MYPRKCLHQFLYLKIPEALSARRVHGVHRHVLANGSASFRSHPNHANTVRPQPSYREFNNRQLDMIISTLSPASIVDDESYVSMIRAANPRRSVMGRSSVTRGVTRRFKSHQATVRAAMTDVSICHVNSDMWTSAANKACGSFVVTLLGKEWTLQTRVLRCCVVEGRQTAFAIAAFLLKLARDFGLSQKVGVVRTDGASNSVAACVVLGDVARQLDDRADHGNLRIIRGSGGAAAGAAAELELSQGADGGRGAEGMFSARRLRSGKEGREAEILASFG